ERRANCYWSSGSTPLCLRDRIPSDSLLQQFFAEREVQPRRRLATTPRRAEPVRGSRRGRRPPPLGIGCRTQGGQPQAAPPRSFGDMAVPGTPKFTWGAALAALDLLKPVTARPVRCNGWFGELLQQPQQTLVIVVTRRRVSIAADAPAIHAPQPEIEPPRTV